MATTYKVGDTIKPSNPVATGQTPGSQNAKYGLVSKSAPAKIVGTKVVNGELYYNVSQKDIGGGTGWLKARDLEGGTPGVMGSKSSSSSATSSKSDLSSRIADTVINTAQKQIDEQKKFLEKYKKNNPFAYDEKLAEEAATAEFDPYYSELLKDYLAEIDVKRQTVEDDKRLTTVLKQYDDTAKSRDYAKAIKDASIGYASKGTYGSGMMESGLGGAEVDYTQSNARANEVYGSQQTGYNRQLGVLDTLASNKQRDIEREKKAAIESSILTRQNEALKQYNAGMTMAASRQFNPGAVEGYLLPAVYRY